MYADVLEAFSRWCSRKGKFSADAMVRADGVIVHLRNCTCRKIMFRFCRIKSTSGRKCGYIQTTGQSAEVTEKLYVCICSCTIAKFIPYILLESFCRNWRIQYMCTLISKGAKHIVKIAELILQESQTRGSSAFWPVKCGRLYCRFHSNLSAFCAFV